jgi:hypothetical protein
MYIISNTSGSCGDIVSAVIDPTYIRLIPKGMIHAPFRNGLIKPNLSEDDIEKFILQASSKGFKSIESLYPKIGSTYSLNDTINTYIAINVSTEAEVNWCLNKISILFPSNIFHSTEYKADSKSAEDIQTAMTNQLLQVDYVINLSDILSGNLISVLSEFVTEPLDEQLYQNWLDLISKKFPHNF